MGEWLIDLWVIELSGDMAEDSESSDCSDIEGD
jgi:hypothetical protein